MHPCPGNCVAIGHAVVYYDQAARAFTAVIKCRHCIYMYVCIHVCMYVCMYVCMHVCVCV